MLALKNSCSEIFRCIEICFLPFSIFEKLCACPEKRSVPWIHCIEYIFFIIQDFWALALKNRVVLKFLTVLKTILIIQDFWATCACSEKQLFWNFSLYWNMFYHSGFSSNFRLPWQQSLPWYFLLYWIYIYHSECLNNFALALKLFTALNIFFIIQDFWATSACSENRVCTEIFHSFEYTFSFWILEQHALSLKIRVALKIFT